MYTDVHFSLGATTHTQAKKVAASDRVAAVPNGTSDVLLVITPAAAALNTVSTESSTCRILSAR